MGNNKGSEIFLGLIGVATLIVAIIGATFAFFSANASSGNEAIRVVSAKLSLGYSDDVTGLKTNLIPSAEKYALYGATNEDYIGPNRENECIDDNRNQICGVYKFSVGNPSFTTAQNLYGSIKIQTNEFGNLNFMILDENGDIVVQKTNFKTEAAKSEDGSTIQLEELDQVLIPSSEEEDGDNPEFAASNENPDPAKFTVVTDTDPVTGKTRYNARSYTMIIWIDETGSDQTEDDSGKIFTAGITFTTANEKIGVSGFISAADDASKN